jgi:hypothetical protein
MTEGWSGDDYLILYSEAERQSASERYGIAALLPGFTIIGLRSWDDFIVMDSEGAVFLVPTVPCDAAHLTEFHLPLNVEIVGDTRYAGRIKWYTKPIIFGGNPRLGENLTWVAPDEHAPLVRWWNRMYRDITAGQPPTFR